MKIVQTLWCGNKNLLNDSFGWVSPEYHIMSWCLSCLRIHKYYKNIHLYTDSQGYEILKNALELPYKNVSVVYDSIKHLNKNLWAYPKILTYKSQDEPFIHIDGDVFIHKKFSSKITKANLIAQNAEKPTEYYYSIIKDLNKDITCIPKHLTNPLIKNKIRSFNAGIIGGFNNTFFNEFYKEAKYFIENNIDSFRSETNITNSNLLFEQMLFAELAHFKNINIDCCIEDIIDDNGYSSKLFGDLSQQNKINILHFIGPIKRDRIHCKMLSSVLANEFPMYFNKVMQLFTNNTLYTKIENDNIIDKQQFLDNSSLKNHLDLITNHRNLLNKIKDKYSNMLPNRFLDIEKNSTLFFNVFNKKNILKKNLTLINNPDLVIIKKSFKWSKAIKKIISEYHNIEEIDQKSGIAVIPKIFTNKIEVIIISEMDYNIIYFLKTEKNIQNIFDSVKKAFPVENQNDPDIWKYFTFRLKFLVYSRCIIIKN